MHCYYIINIDFLHKRTESKILFRIEKINVSYIVVMADVLEFQIKDEFFKNITKGNPYYIDIKGSVNICLIRCGQEITECNSVNFSSMTNYGKILVLNSDPKKVGKCNIKLAFDSVNESKGADGSSKYTFQKAFFTVPSLHRINGAFADMETFLIFSSTQLDGSTLYVCVCAMSNATDYVESNDWKLLNYKLMNELFVKNTQVPEMFQTNSINGPPNPVDLMNFLPVEGLRSFYDYTNPSNTKVNFKVYQTPLAVSTEVIEALKAKLTPKNIYQNFKDAISLTQNPATGLYFYFSQDLSGKYKSLAQNVSPAKPAIKNVIIDEQELELEQELDQEQVNEESKNVPSKLQTKKTSNTDISSKTEQEEKIVFTDSDKKVSEDKESFESKGDLTSRIANILFVVIYVVNLVIVLFVYYYMFYFCNSEGGKLQGSSDTESRMEMKDILDYIMVNKSVQTFLRSKSIFFIIYILLFLITIIFIIAYFGIIRNDNVKFSKVATLGTFGFVFITALTVMCYKYIYFYSMGRLSCSNDSTIKNVDTYGLIPIMEMASLNIKSFAKFLFGQEPNFDSRNSQISTNNSGLTPNVTTGVNQNVNVMSGGSNSKMPPIMNNIEKLLQPACTQEEEEKINLMTNIKNIDFKSGFMISMYVIMGLLLSLFITYTVKISKIESINSPSKFVICSFFALVIFGCISFFIVFIVKILNIKGDIKKSAGILTTCTGATALAQTGTTQLTEYEQMKQSLETLEKEINKKDINLKQKTLQLQSLSEQRENEELATGVMKQEEKELKKRILELQATIDNLSSLDSMSKKGALSEQNKQYIKSTIENLKSTLTSVQSKYNNLDTRIKQLTALSQIKQPK